MNSTRYRIDVMKEDALDFLKYKIDVKDPLFIRARISRHSGPNTHKTYAVFVLIDKALKGVNSIIEHYCQCKSGSRTVGCCSHIMAIVW